MRCRFHFVLLLLVSVIGLAQAQGAANSLGLMGGVQDTSGAVIVGAQVSLTTQDGGIVAQGITDSSGAFRFTNIRAGNYSIDVAQIGFQEVKQPIKVGSGARPQVRIVLSVASVRQDVIVAASSSPAQVSTEISQNQDSNSVDRDALDRLPVYILDPDAPGSRSQPKAERHSSTDQQTSYTETRSSMPRTHSL